ncbi:hypothetical protein SUGI_1052520 [Cryptomeria japonica]|nr:hypothetical protein SUGI_1052520 [Cryptomeria japonica]
MFSSSQNKMEGFGGGKILFGEIEAVQVSVLEKVWGSPDTNGATFYKPLQIPEGFFVLGHYGCPNAQQSVNSPFLLVSITQDRSYLCERIISAGPPLEEPSDYNLVWSSNEGQAYFWVPQAPEGYKALGCVVTNTPAKPTSKELLMCVRSDLTDTCQTEGAIWSNNSFTAWNIRSKIRGKNLQGPMWVHSTAKLVD